MKLDEFLAEIGRAGAIAARSANEHVENRFRQMCEEEDGVHTPIYIKLKLEENKEPIKIARYALSSCRSLDLESLDVEFETSLEIVDDGDIVDSWNPSDTHRGSFSKNQSISPKLKELQEAREDSQNSESEKPESSNTVPSSKINMTMRHGLSETSMHIKVKAVFSMKEPPESVEVLKDKMVSEIRKKILV